MERLLIKEISNHEGEKITIKGRIFNILHQKIYPHLSFSFL
jgi:hypothetical protein